MESILNHYDHYNHFFENDFFNVLYQLYFTLSLFKYKFTHYDLHLENVLLYIPNKKGYITYHYSSKGKVINFHSPYLVKIIDYGRCYINNEKSHISSLEYAHQVCDTPKCVKCGTNDGYNWLQKNSNSQNMYISSKTNNISHDLRYLVEINLYIKKNKLKVSNKIQHFLNSILYGLDIENEKYKRYGTKEINKLEKDLYNKKYPNKLKNVSEVKNKLEELVSLNDFYVKSSYKKMGDLYIYDDGRDMFFSSYQNFNSPL
jgi:hypothetical protein